MSLDFVDWLMDDLRCGGSEGPMQDFSSSSEEESRDVCKCGGSWGPIPAV